MNHAEQFSAMCSRVTLLDQMAHWVPSNPTHSMFLCFSDSKEHATFHTVHILMPKINQIPPKNEITTVTLPLPKKNLL